MSKILFFLLLVGGALLMPAQSFNMNSKGPYVLLTLAGAIPVAIGFLGMMVTQAHTDGRAVSTAIFLIGGIAMTVGLGHIF